MEAVMAVVAGKTSVATSATTPESGQLTLWKKGDEDVVLAGVVPERGEVFVSTASGDLVAVRKDAAVTAPFRDERALYVCLGPGVVVEALGGGCAYWKDASGEAGTPLTRLPAEGKRRCPEVKSPLWYVPGWLQVDRVWQLEFVASNNDSTPVSPLVTATRRYACIHPDGARFTITVGGGHEGVAPVWYVATRTGGSGVCASAGVGGDGAKGPLTDKIVDVRVCAVNTSAAYGTGDMPPTVFCNENGVVGVYTVFTGTTGTHVGAIVLDNKYVTWIGTDDGSIHTGTVECLPDGSCRVVPRERVLVSTCKAVRSMYWHDGAGVVLMNPKQCAVFVPACFSAENVWDSWGTVVA